MAILAKAILTMNCAYRWGSTCYLLQRMAAGGAPPLTVPLTPTPTPTTGDGGGRAPPRLDGDGHLALAHDLRRAHGGAVPRQEPDPNPSYNPPPNPNPNPSYNPDPNPGPGPYP